MEVIYESENELALSPDCERAIRDDSSQDNAIRLVKQIKSH